MKVEISVKTKLGMRIIKTGIAIYLALLICNLLGFEKGALAAVTAVVCLQPSLMGSLKTIKNQILATIIGCSIAIVTSYYFHGYGLSIAIAAIITIWICIRLGWQESITLAVITLILIADNTNGEFVAVVTNRVYMIFIGLGVAFMLNFILPPSHTSRLICKVDQLRKAFEDFYIKGVDDLLKKEPMTAEEIEEYRDNIKGLIDESWNIYDLSIDSKLSYQQSKAKDLNWLMRRAINSMENNLERLLEIHYSISQVSEFDDQQTIKKEIHYYLQEIFIYHQETFQCLLLDQPIQDSIIQDLLKKQKEIEETIMSLVPLLSLQAFNYYNMVMEGERIINQLQNLLKAKELKLTDNNQKQSLPSAKANVSKGE